jgi:hypothetical protein
LVANLQLFTDVSDWGWGAVMNNYQTGAPWDPVFKKEPINLRELRAIWFGLQYLLPLVKNRVVRVYSDNCTAVSYLQKQGGTRSWDMFLLAREVLLGCKLHRVTVKCHYIPGKVNVTADSLSRDGIGEKPVNTVLPTEWRLNPVVVKQVWTQRHCPLIDLFAMSENAVLPLFFSPVPHPNILGTDALFHSWDGLNAYAFPPWNLLPAVVRKIEGPSRGSKMATKVLVPLSLPLVRRKTPEAPHKKRPAIAESSQGCNISRRSGTCITRLEFIRAFFKRRLLPIFVILPC